MAFTLPRLQAAFAIITKEGLPTFPFQQWWQSVVEKIEAQEGAQDKIIADLATAQDTADAIAFHALTADRANTANTAKVAASAGTATNATNAANATNANNANKVGNALTIGTGLSGGSYDGSAPVTIINTAPDRTVTLVSGGGCTITGTYPNFTISVP